MSRSNSQEDFFQPVISTLGLVSSVIATLIPLFPIEQVKNLFIEKSYIGVVSSTAFLLGFIVVWMILELKLGYISIPLGTKKNRGNGYPEPWKYLTTGVFISILLFFNILLITGFLLLSKSTGFYLGVFQAVLYIFFFLLLIASFSLIYSISKMAHDYNEQKISFQKTVFDTLERNGHLTSAIEISETYQLNNQDIRAMGIPGFVPIAKLVIIKTIHQDEKKLECILSADGKEIVRVKKI